MDKLDIGQYLLLLSPTSSFEKKHIFREFTISKLSYLERGERLLVVDRKSGEPLEGVEAIFKNDKNSWSKKSDSRGFINFGKVKETYHLVLKKGDDILDINYNQVNRKYSQNYPDKGYQNVYFFTDRSIYRPKQTIYFKGLALKRYNEKKPKVLSNKKVTVTVSLYLNQ